MLELRAAGPADASRFARLALESFPNPWSEEALRSELGSPCGRGLLACARPGQPCGFLLGRALEQEAELLLIAVAESERGRGVGRALLERFLSDLRRAGARRVTLEVRDSNQAARRLYHRSGFEEWGRRPRYYPGGEAGLLYGVDL